MTTISRWAGGVLLAASLLPWAAAANAGTTQGSGDVQINQNQVPTTAATFANHNCASGDFDQSQIDAGKDGYHFVLTGTGFTLTELRAYFDFGTVTTTSFVQNGKQAYIYVQHGSTLNDAWADVTPKPGPDANIQLVLSGTCVGSGGTTTTPPCPTTTVTKTVTESAPPVTQTVTATHTVTTTAPGATQTVTTTAPGETTTVTAPPVTVTAPPVTVTETKTATVTATQTVTTTAPGETTTVTAPPVTVTTTAPGATQTVTTTAPGETTTVTAPGATQTVTATVTTSAGTSVLPTKVGQSTTPATGVLGEKTGSLPQTGPGLPVGKALALSLALMIAGVGLLALPGHVGLEINRKH